MASTITKNVKDFAADEKRTLEGLLGEPLAKDQEVFIFAYTPGALPDDATRADAKNRLEKTISSNQAFAKSEGVDSAEADEAVSEAMRQTRRRA